MTVELPPRRRPLQFFANKRSTTRRRLD